jgi:hypothetical protein
MASRLDCLASTTNHLHHLPSFDASDHIDLIIGSGCASLLHAPCHTTKVRHPLRSLAAWMSCEHSFDMLREHHPMSWKISDIFSFHRSSKEILMIGT